MRVNFRTHRIASITEAEMKQWQKMRKQLTPMQPEIPPLLHSLKCRKKSPHLG